MRLTPSRLGLSRLGPGMLLAATSIGASHLLMSPEAGARFEYRLVWLVILVHLLKYPAFEFAPRWVAATGTSLLEAYEKAPGPRRWAIWLGLADMTVQAVGLVAALVGLTASFCVAAFGTFSLPVWSLALTFVLLALLAAGHYRLLRGVNLLLLALLALGTAIAFLGAPPPLSALPDLVTPSFPAGSLVLVSAILGFMPTSVAVSIWHSLWALEHGRFQQRRTTTDERRRLLADGLFDLRVGYGLSAVLAVLFVCLGAVLLHPRGLVPEGPEVAVVLSRLYTLVFQKYVLGEWMRQLVLMMAFAALFTTCYTMMDGFPRSFVAARRVLRGHTSYGGRVDRVYWTFLLTVTFGGMAILSQLPDPALLVKVVGAFGLVLSPVYYILNLWAVRRLVEDPELRPGLATTALALAGILAMVGTAVLLLWTTF